MLDKTELRVKDSELERRNYEPQTTDGLHYKNKSRYLRGIKYFSRINRKASTEIDSFV